MEKDPNGLSPNTPGAKLDAGKAPVWQGAIAYFPRAFVKLAELSAYGANKYAWKGWEKVSDGVNRYSNALARHAVKETIEGAWDKEIENDPKFPACVLHATQVAWNAMARLELILREQEKPKKQGNMTPVRPDLYSQHQVREQMDPVRWEHRIKAGGVTTYEF